MILRRSGLIRVRFLLDRGEYHPGRQLAAETPSLGRVLFDRGLELPAGEILRLSHAVDEV